MGTTGKKARGRADGARKLERRTDVEGYLCRPVRVPGGSRAVVTRRGVRVMVVPAEHLAPAATKAEIAEACKEALRWVDKTGHASPMASASRDRAQRKAEREADPVDKPLGKV